MNIATDSAGNILNREQFYIDKLKPEYNLLKIAGSRLGTKLSEFSRSKISKSLTGFKASELTKEKIRISRLGVAPAPQPNQQKKN